MFNKLTKQKFISAAIMLFGVTAGMMAGGAATSVIPLDDMRIKQIITILVGATGYASLKSSGKLEKFLKSVGLGIAANGAYSLATDTLKQSVTPDKTTLIGRATAGALGLSCPCGGNSLSGRLNAPSGVSVNWDAPSVQPIGQVQEPLGIAAPYDHVEELNIA